MNLVKQEI
jgi:hypothetical protein